jgi:GDP-L-fucose synthase
MTKTDSIFIAGAYGMVGSAIKRLLVRQGYINLITPTKEELDLTNQKEVFRFFKQKRPDYVFMAAAKVGGILNNANHPADFIYQNTAIQSNLIYCSHRFSQKALFLGSSCVYPKKSVIPIKETFLLKGPLEPTNEAYAVAKINGIKMCEAFNQQYKKMFLTVMPCNLYGENDYYSSTNSHVIPALILKFFDAVKNNKPSVSVWGSGNPKREFLHVDDLASACLFVFKKFINNEIDTSIVNIGSGVSISIRELAFMIAEIAEFKGEIVFDKSHPDGVFEKTLDISIMQKLGWYPEITLMEGLSSVYNRFKLTAHAYGNTENIRI